LRQAFNPPSTFAEAEKGKRFEEYLRLDRLLLGWDCDVHKELLCVLVLPTQVPQEEQQQTCLNSPQLYNLLLLLRLCLQLQLQLSNLSALHQLQESSRKKQFWQWMSEESLQAMVGKTKVATSDEVDIARFFLLDAIEW
jgi:hypothetical protein